MHNVNSFLLYYSALEEEKKFNTYNPPAYPTNTQYAISISNPRIQTRTTPITDPGMFRICQNMKSGDWMILVQNPVAITTAQNAAAPRFVLMAMKNDTTSLKERIITIPGVDNVVIFDCIPWDDGYFYCVGGIKNGTYWKPARFIINGWDADDNKCLQLISCWVDQIDNISASSHSYWTCIRYPYSTISSYGFTITDVGSNQNVDNVQKSVLLGGHIGPVGLNGASFAQRGIYGCLFYGRWDKNPESYGENDADPHDGVSPPEKYIVTMDPTSTTGPWTPQVAYVGSCSRGGASRYDGVKDYLDPLVIRRYNKAAFRVKNTNTIPSNSARRWSWCWTFNMSDYPDSSYGPKAGSLIAMPGLYCTTEEHYSGTYENMMPISLITVVGNHYRWHTVIGTDMHNTATVSGNLQIHTGNMTFITAPDNGMYLSNLYGTYTERHSHDTIISRRYNIETKSLGVSSIGRYISDVGVIRNSTTDIKGYFGGIFLQGSDFKTATMNVACFSPNGTFVVNATLHEGEYWFSNNVPGYHPHNLAGYMAFGWRCANRKLFITFRSLTDKAYIGRSVSLGFEEKSAFSTDAGGKISTVAGNWDATPTHLDSTSYGPTSFDRYTTEIGLSSVAQSSITPDSSAVQPSSSVSIARSQIQEWSQTEPIAF